MATDPECVAGDTRPPALVADLLATDYTTIAETATLEAAAQVLLEQQLESVVVTKERRPIGVLTIEDVLSGLSRIGETSTEKGNVQVV
jgi:CBS domain-containing protein